MVNQTSNISLILHLGFPKCGSTSIQNFLYSNLEQLKKQKIYLPDENLRLLDKFNQQKYQPKPPIKYFYNLIYNKQDLNILKQQLTQLLFKAQKQNCRSIIISAESLAGLSINNITRSKIHQIIASCFPDIQVIFYLKRQDDYLISGWREWGILGGESIESLINQSLDDNNPNFLEVIQDLAQIYGQENITVVPLVKKALKEENLIIDFCSRINFKVSQETNIDIHSNKGLNLYLCEILGRLPPHANLFYNLNKQLLIKYVENKEILFANDRSFISLATRNQILDRFEEENKKLHQEYFSYLAYEDFIDRNAYNNQIETKDAEYELEKIKDVMAIQMELILKLLKEKEERKNNTFFNQVANFKRKITNLFSQN